MKYITIGAIIWLSILNTLRSQTPVFDPQWLPVIGSLELVNTSRIQLIWQASPKLNGIDISQQPGSFTVRLSGTSQFGYQSMNTRYNSDRLNSTGTLLLSGLTLDTIYCVCVISKWFPINSTSNDDTPGVTNTTFCKLMRTYASGKKIRDELFIS